MSWMTVNEPVSIWSEKNFTVQGLMEHLNVTKDSSDYLWYFTRIFISTDDIVYWKKNWITPSLTIDKMRDVVRIFINGQLTGSAVGHWVKVVQPVQLQPGHNTLALLSLTVGLQNYGAFFEKDGGGFRGCIKLMGLSKGDLDLTYFPWTYQVGLNGEFNKIYTVEGSERALWTKLAPDGVQSTLSWYKTYFVAPEGSDPVAVNLRRMGKGQAWVNGHHIGRYWILDAPDDGCQKACDYRGPYSSNKCRTNCGKPTQIWYHIPRSWLQASNNLLVIFEEIGGNPFEIEVKSRSVQTVCALVSESHYPPISMWSHADYAHEKVSMNDSAPEMHLRCPTGYLISVQFASYGNPQGSCQSYIKGSCHAFNSFNVVYEACQRRENCSILVSNGRFGKDPCPGTAKMLAVEAGCMLPESLFGVSAM